MGEEPEWFRATSGRATGLAGVAAAAVVAGAAVLDPGAHLPVVIAGSALAAMICWVMLLRPRVGLTDTTLVLRSMLDTVHLPLAAVEAVSVGQVLAVRVGGRRYVSPAVGKPVHRVIREAVGRGPAGGGGSPLGQMPYPDYVALRIEQRVADARKRRQPAPGSPGEAALAGEVRRERAVPEIVGLAVTAAALVVALLR